MTAAIQFVLGVTALSLITTYAQWTRFRVWRLRQDLFAIRDEMWDAMEERGGLEDPDYCEVRRTINALIRIAPLLSIFTLLRFYMQVRTEEPRRLKINFATPVGKAQVAYMERILQYFFRETMSGKAIALAAFLINWGMVPMMAIREGFGGKMQPIVESEDFVHFSEMAPQERGYSMSAAN